MYNDRITENFFEAITSYAKKQEQEISDEVNAFKEAELKRAEEESLEEAYNLIQKELNQRRTDIRTQLAQKEQSSRRELFKLRADMTDEIFKFAAERLQKFTEGKDYPEKIRKSAEKMATLFKGKPCTIYMRSEDLNLSGQISGLFGGNAVFAADSGIKLGGIRGVCSEMRIKADETFDTLLELERRTFAEKSTLKVVS